MSNENVPAISTGLLPTQQEFSMYQFIAQTAMKSGLYGGVGGEAEIFMVLLAARELGISPMIALNGGIWNIKGRIEISARLMNAMIRRKGHTLTITGDNKSCTIVGKRCDTSETAEETFTIEMAKTAGLIKEGGVWQKYPEDMLYNRCISRLARRLFSDVIGTAYVEGEIREIPPEDLKPSFYEEVNKPPRLDDDQVADAGKVIEYISKDDALAVQKLCVGLSDEVKDNVKKLFNVQTISQVKQEDLPKLIENVKRLRALNNLPEII